MLPRQHAYYFFLAYLAVFLWFWASQAGSFKNLRMLRTTTLTVLPVVYLTFLTVCFDWIYYLELGVIHITQSFYLFHATFSCAY